MAERLKENCEKERELELAGDGAGQRLEEWPWLHGQQARRSWSKGWRRLRDGREGQWRPTVEARAGRGKWHSGWFGLEEDVEEGKKEEKEKEDREKKIKKESCKMHLYIRAS